MQIVTTSLGITFAGICENWETARGKISMCSVGASHWLNSFRNRPFWIAKSRRHGAALSAALRLRFSLRG